MALIDYLTTETPTAARMNVLFAEADRKLSLALDQKSIFFWPGCADYIGKVFLFLGGRTVITSNMFSLTTPAGGADYDHNFFTSIANGLRILGPDFPRNPLNYFLWPYYDQIRKVVRVEQPTAEEYAAIGTEAGTDRSRFFENSLQVHKRSFTPPGSDETALYNLLVNNDGDAPGTVGDLEQVRKWEQIEICCDHKTVFTFPAQWDKYQVFRIHNFHSEALAFTFQGGPTVNIPAHGSKCVRRQAGVYTEGYNHFQKFLTDDPICYAGGLRQTQGELANNLINPRILLDIYSALSLTGQLPQFIYDFTKFWDATSTYCNGTIFPVMAPETPIGDLVTHKGKLVAVKTEQIGAQLLETAATEIDFDGYRTLKGKLESIPGVTVGDDASYLSVDSADQIDLATISTNLLRGAVFSLQNGLTLPVRLYPRQFAESAIKHDQERGYVGDGALSNIVGYTLSGVEVLGGIPRGIWTRITEPVIQSNPVTAVRTGLDADNSNVFTAGSFGCIEPLSKLQNLEIISRSNSPNSDIGTYSNIEVKMTGFGLMVTADFTVSCRYGFEERFDEGVLNTGVIGTESRSVVSISGDNLLIKVHTLLSNFSEPVIPGDQDRWTAGISGWPSFLSGALSGDKFLSPRIERGFDRYRYVQYSTISNYDIFHPSSYPLPTVDGNLGIFTRNPYWNISEESPSAPEDHEPIEFFESGTMKTGIKFLGSFSPETITNGLYIWYNGISLTVPDATDPLINETHDGGSLEWWGQNRAQLIAGTPGDIDTQTFDFMPLERDHYNNMASVVNAAVKFIPMDFLSWFGIGAGTGPLAGKTLGTLDYRPRNQWRDSLTVNEFSNPVLIGVPVRGRADIIGDADLIAQAFPAGYSWHHIDDIQARALELGFRFVIQEALIPLDLTILRGGLFIETVDNLDSANIVASHPGGLRTTAERVLTGDGEPSQDPDYPLSGGDGTAVFILNIGSENEAHIFIQPKSYIKNTWTEVTIEKPGGTIDGHTIQPESEDIFQVSVERFDASEETLQKFSTGEDEETIISGPAWGVNDTFVFFDRSISLGD